MQYKGLPIDSQSAAKMMKSGMHGYSKSEVLNRQADGCGSAVSPLLVPTGMPEDNPFKSEKQRKFLYSQKPAVAKKFAMHGKTK